MVVSLLEPQEELDLDLKDEAKEARDAGLEFISFPIPDRQVPESEHRLARTLDKLEHSLSSGTRVLIHCRQGVGRSGLVAACLLVKKGLSPGAAVEILTAVRGVPVPETEVQRDWIDHYAAAPTK